MLLFLSRRPPHFHASKKPLTNIFVSQPPPPSRPSITKYSSSTTTTGTSKMRLPYTPNPPPASDPETASIISRIRERRSPRPLQALDLTLLHSPNVADGWNSFLGAIRTRTSLEDHVREIAICRVAVVSFKKKELKAKQKLSTFLSLFLSFPCGYILLGYWLSRNRSRGRTA